MAAAQFPPDEPIALRQIEIRPIEHNGPAFLLRDPLRLAEGNVVVPRDLAPLLALFDGSSTYAELRAEIAAQIGVQSGPALLDQMLDALDQALLLDNATFRTALEHIRNDYRAAPFRPPTLAGIGYPEQPDELHGYFDGLLAEAGDVEVSPPTIRSVLSPHIDYPRGGPIYAKVWKSVEAATRAAELVVLLATDHYSPEPFTLTRQRYATPYGPLPTDAALIEQLAEAIGPAAFDAELFHRSEHSVELVANWIHHLRGDSACPVIPLLCGSFQRFTGGEADPAADPQIGALTEVLRQIASQRRTLIVVSGDLAHVGPAFGGRALDASAEQRLRDDDQALLTQLCSGHADQFFRAIRAVRDRNNVCGLPPGYLALRALGATQGEIVGYQRCPADEANASAVTIAGVVLA